MRYTDNQLSRPLGLAYSLLMVKTPTGNPFLEFKLAYLHFYALKKGTMITKIEHVHDKCSLWSLWWAVLERFLPTNRHDGAPGAGDQHTESPPCPFAPKCELEHG